jgi:hypothetical protein
MKREIVAVVVVVLGLAALQGPQFAKVPVAQTVPLREIMSSRRIGVHDHNSCLTQTFHHFRNLLDNLLSWWYQPEAIFLTETFSDLPIIYC